MLKLLQHFGYFPRNVVWELTLACNLRCRHCGSRAGQARDDELPTDRGLQLCHELAELGTRRVTLGGGEPTLHHCWGMYASTLVQLGVRVTMTTNGLHWDRQLARRAQAFGLESVCFSIDGLKQTHEHMRRVPGHFEQLLRALTICRDMKIPATVITTVTRGNLGELEDLHRLLGEYGVRSWQIQLGNPTGCMEDHPELVIAPEDVLEVVPLVARMRREGKRPRIFAGDNIGYYGGCEPDLRNTKATVPFWAGCRAGCQVLGIESNGTVKGCLSLPSSLNQVDDFVEGSVADRPLAEIWNSLNAFSYNRAFKLDDLGGFCRTCDYAEICRGGCFWTSYAHTRGQRDNPYCYYRQLKLKQQRQAEEQG